MSTSTIITERLSLSKGALELAADLRAFAKKRPFLFREKKFFRAEVEIENMDLLACLKNQEIATKIFWEDRAKDLIFAGMGCADSITALKDETYGHVLGRIKKRLSKKYPQAHYWGGFCFDPTFPPENEWKNWGIGRFILPLIEIRQTATGTVLAANINLKDKNIPQLIERVCVQLMRLDASPLPEPVSMPIPQSWMNLPDEKTWKATAAYLINNIQSGLSEKVVLARSVYLTFEKALDPFVLMQGLRQTTSNCFYFVMQFQDSEAFLGASPERLYQRQGEKIATEAVAGTYPLTKPPFTGPDEQHVLLKSEKDLKEQNYVVEMIRKNLKPLCVMFETQDHPSLLNSSGGQHLITRFEGKLKRRIADETLMSQLHPTPAVAGTPSKVALRTIRELETFGRGWYGGPVGYIGTENSEFTVAIRSGLLHKKALHLYAGAGIIRESMPNAEWNETESKLQSFLKLFDTHARQIS